MKKRSFQNNHLLHHSSNIVNGLADDLDYFSDLGEAKIPINRRDIQQLKQSVRLRVDYASSIGVFHIILLVVGVAVFMGVITLARIKNTRQQVVASSTIKKIFRPAKHSEERCLKEDFRNIDSAFKPSVWRNENFLHAIKSKQRDSLKNETKEFDLQSMEPSTLSSVTIKKDSSDLLKPSYNSSVLFIGGLKVANYHRYYFKEKERDILVKPGRDAQFSGADDQRLWVQERSGEYQDIPVTDILRQGLVSFSNGNYKASDYYFSELLKLRAEDVNALFYLGMSNYTQTKYERAINFFNQLMEDENNAFHEESEFYLACTLLKVNRLDQAKPILESVTKRNGFYRERADLMFHQYFK